MKRHPPCSSSAAEAGGVASGSGVCRGLASVVEAVRTEERSKESDLETRVALMRRLGVVEWDGIRLGPAPSPAVPRRELTPDEIRADMAAHAERERKRTFGASGVSPR